MPPIKSAHTWSFLPVLLLPVLVALVFLPPALKPSSAASQQDAVITAWNAARQAGTYHFSSDITQVTLPAATIANVGRAGRTEKLYLEGQNNLDAQQMELTLWSNGGNMLDKASGTSIRTEHGKAFARAAGGGEWKEIDDFTSSIAPQGDFLSYLTAIKDVKPLGEETRNGIAFSRYAFNIDSPRFADYMHQQLEAMMQARGELLPGMQLGAPAYFRDMVGSGELWVGTDGLPLRQILTLQFPPQNDEQTQSQIVVNFSEFGAGKLIPPTAQDQAISILNGIQFAPLLGIISVFAFVALLITRRTRRVQVVVIGLLIVTQVTGPLLNSVITRNFVDAQTAKAAAAKERQTEVRNDRELRNALGTMEFNPHLSPLEKAGQANITRVEQGHVVAPLAPSLNDALNDTLSRPAIPASASALQADTGLDTDADGLTDYAEERISTSPVISDTDNDGIRDNIEVAGFMSGGQRWYTDPESSDSNGDGQSDALEWGLDNNGLLATPLDTDSDGIPDLFDEDNDGDGVPDNKDLNVFTKGASTYSDSDPLLFKVNNLTPNKPAFVEFQIRPQDPKQLWYAFNVLDWPQDDAGQMRDVDGKTYADVAVSGGLTPSNGDANGDMKVVPMLEIRIPADSANLPPQSDLTPFNISINDYSSDGQTKVAYIPLNVVVDEKTGQRVAFSAQMRYLPSGIWLNPHQVRLSWLVQALVDLPCDKSADTSTDCQADGIRNNVPQVIHSYYGPWTLTGLTVREDHGADMAVIYEDPAVDSNKKDDAALWALSFVLDHHFVIGRDDNNDNQRDLKVSDLTARFDRDNNPSEVQRFAVPNILQVQSRSFTTLDEALASTTMTTTKQVLNQFNASVASDPAIKPLLFFAQESRTRAVSLDTGLAGAGYASQNGRNLTLDMAPPSQPVQEVVVLAGLKWMGYCPAGSPISWQPCADDDYWDELERRYAAVPSEPGETNPDLVTGRLQLTQFYYSGFRAGYVSTVQQGPAVISSRYSLVSQSTTENTVRAIAQGITAVPRLAAEAYSRVGYIYNALGPDDGMTQWAASYKNRMKSYLKKRDASRLQGDGFSDTDRAKYKREVRTLKLEYYRLKLGRVATVGAVLMVVSQVLSYLPDIPPTARGVLSAVTIALSIGVTVVIPAIELALVLKTFGSTLRLAMRITSTVPASIQKGGVVGLVVAAAVTWGFFIYGAVTNGYTVGSPELNRAFFEAVASTIVTIIMFVLALNPVGAIIGAVLGVIDLIFNLTCELGVSELRNVPGLDGACFSITTLVTKYLSKLLYSYDLMINLERSDLMTTDSPQVALGDPSKGYVAGNTLSVTLPVTTIIINKNPDPNNGVLIYPYMYLFSEGNLKKSSFVYSLTRSADIVSPVSLDQMSSAWKNVRERNAAEGGKYLVSPMYRADMRTVPAPLTDLPLATGINGTVPLKLNMSYAIPAYECFLLAVIPICYVREFKGNNHLPINSLQYDVLPPTLGEFLALVNKPDSGVGLGWDARFPSLRDADGDGLISSVYMGLDPNDLSADADGDGLTDRFELDQRSAGVEISPILRDTDNDGLDDLQELRLGSNPAAADTDNDGLTDGQEVHHLIVDPNTGAPSTTWAGGWDVQINATVPFSVHVSSDPTNADSDNDSLSDQTERQLALDANPANRLDSLGQPYHPNVRNNPPLALLLETDDFDGYLAPGQSYLYTSTAVASAAMVSGVLNVQPAPGLGNVSQPLQLAFNPLTFSTTQTATQGISLTVSPSLTTQRMSLTSTANTRLQDTGAAGWAFGTVATEAPLGGILSPKLPYFSEVAASRADRQDNFLISALTIQSSGSIGFGDILGYSIPGGSVRAIENDANNTAAILGNRPHNLATNGSGDTLAVWDQQRYCNTITINSLKVVTAGADGQDASAGIEPVIGFAPSDTAETVVWRWDQNAGASMTSGQTRGPNASGFPLTLTYCNGSLNLKVYDNDGATNELVNTSVVDVYLAQNGTTRTFTGAGHTIELNITVPLRDANVISGTLIGLNGEIKRAISFPTSPVPTGYRRQNYRPVVASDGNGFLVAYESFAENASNANYGLPQVVIQTFDKDGNPLNTTYGDAASTQAGVPGDGSLALAAAWTGSSYRVLWQDRRDNEVYWASTSTGQTLSAAQLVSSSGMANAESTYAPGISYDPISNRTFIMYLGSSRNILARVYANTTLVAGPQVVSLAQFPAARSPQVAWHPGYKGWLLSYQDNTALQRHVFVPLDTSANQAFAPTTGFFIAADDNALACPLPQSAPSVDLRFEELPNATRFADSSGQNNPGTCSGATCPTSGFFGAPNAAQSDYAVQFDGVDDQLTLSRTITDDFSVAFWINAPNRNGQQILLDGGNFNTNGFQISLNNGGVTARVPGIGFQTSRIDNGQWRFVVVSRNKASGRVDIYVDGVLAVGLNGTADVALNSVPDLRIGKNRTNSQLLLAKLDNFQIFPSTLLSDTVQALYNRTQQSYCVAAGPSTTLSNVYWARVVANQQDVRGGPVSASNVLSLTIDADLPTAQFSSVQNGQIVAAGQVVGGSVSDATSGVALVQVSVNNGAWLTATGTNSWAFSLAGYAGVVSLRARGVDRVGNIGNPSAAINVTIDKDAPVLTINTPPATLKPTKNGLGQWQVPLSGSVSDAISGVKSDSVQVILEQQSRTGMPQRTQAVVLNGASWSVNYLLNDGIYDPTGAYTITVQAQDKLGNRATPVQTVVRLDTRGPNASLNPIDIARPAISQTITIGGVVSDTDSIVGINKLEIAFTPIEQLATLPGGLTSDAVDAQLRRTWTPVNLTSSGATSSAWSFQIPAGLENIYQIDLRGTDALGNVAISSNLWRGTIDTTNPRVIMTAANTGVSYVDAATKQRLYAIRFLCAATDRNLNQKSFTCPGASVAPAARTFTTTSALQVLFPGWTVVNGLAISYTQWLPSIPGVSARACDTLGRCAIAATTSGPVSNGEASPSISAAPQAVIVTPNNDSTVAVDAVFSVTVEAEAAASLKTVEIRLDGVPVQTLSFGQDQAVTQTLRTIRLNNIPAGPHILTAIATDWTNAVQNTTQPVSFIADTAPPVVTIDASALTDADTWQAQSGILRFQGTASDALGLAAVQVRVDNGEFVDATFDGSTWRTAIFVPDPEGRTLSVVVRATDRAGRTTQISQSISSNIAVAAGLDTAITSAPANPSAVNTAAFAFTGSGGAAVFECQLDALTYQPCASPNTYNGLSKGAHTFKVRAINSAGAVDGTPASFSWTVNAQQPEVFISAGPAGTSNSRSASFVFSGAAGTIGFECALDGGAFVPCTSPQTYTNLGDGTHTFVVRAVTASNTYGTPSQFTWTVVNAAPVVSDLSFVIVPNVGNRINLALATTNSDGLVYKIVAGPSHGVLLGTAPDLTYVPDTDFNGQDRFTFKVDDGQLESNVATVTLTVGLGRRFFAPVILRNSADGN